MSSPGFEPRHSGTAVSVTNHCSKGEDLYNLAIAKRSKGNGKGFGFLFRFGNEMFACQLHKIIAYGEYGLSYRDIDFSTCRHGEKQRLWCAERPSWMQLGHNKIFSDETRFYVQYSDGRIRVWWLPGDPLSPTRI
ncbi:hypothetical protein TNCV_376601 [Trichonephila clavipes]|nr:hypothetical protein TNCV_376601 [Trichonephila clavipes]